MKELIIATNNLNKFSEIKSLLEPLGVRCLSLADVGYKEEIIEDGETFFDNAFIKAMTIANNYHMPALGDDSGIIVESLPEELGVRSKRFSEEGTHLANNLLLLEKLKDKSNRKAHFVSWVVLYLPSGTYYSYQGQVHGKIAEDFKGDNGFGYDPLFIVDGMGVRMAELSESEKNMISHRGQALKMLVRDIKDETIDFQ